MPCLEWLAAKVEWEQGSGPKGPMSCRTQGWISRRPEKAHLRPLGLLSLLFNENIEFFFHFIVNFPCYSIWILYFFQKIVNFPCYSIGISHFLTSIKFSMLFNGNFIFFSFLYQFSMLFNGNFAFLQFSMLFNGNMRLRSFGGGGMDGWTDGRSSGNLPLCPTGHRPFGAAAQKRKFEKIITVQ